MARKLQNMLKKGSKEPAWKQSLRDVADNPDYIFQEMDALRKELQKDNPDPAYMMEKARHIQQWIEEISKFHTSKGVV